MGLFDMFDHWSSGTTARTEFNQEHSHAEGSKPGVRVFMCCWLVGGDEAET